MPRQTADVIALILAIVVAVVVVATAFAILYLKLIHPEQEAYEAIDAISRIISVLVAALVGYMAGRSRNGNGHS